MPRNTEDSIDLRSTEVTEILNKIPPKIIMFGSLSILMIIILVLIFSWIIKYPDIIISQAIITTNKSPQKEISNVSGKFERILVTNNQKVEKDQLMAVIENAANFKDVFKLKEYLSSLSFDDQPFQFNNELLVNLNLGDIETAYSQFDNYCTQYKLNIELRPYVYEVDNFDVIIIELNHRLENFIQQRLLQIKELDLMEKDLQRNTSLYEGGVISTQLIEQKQLEYTRAKRAFKTLEINISQIRERIKIEKINVNKSKIEFIKDETILRGNIIKAYNTLLNAIKEWEFKYTLSSKIDGTVTFLNYWNENQTVTSGDLVFTIVPNTYSKFLAKLSTPLRNSGKIKIGQTVFISLENYPESEFGYLRGKVESISLVAVEDYYVVNVNLSSNLKTTYNKNIEFRQEMTGTAEIVTEDLRLIERFFYQLMQVFKRN